MMNTYTFITSDHKLLSLSSNPFGDIHMAFEITDLHFFNNFSVKELHHSNFLASDNLNFSVYLDLNESVIDAEKMVQYICSNRNLLLQFIFHPRYTIISQRPVFCFNETDRNKPALVRLISNLNELFINQGYEELEAVYFNEQRDSHFSDTLNFCFSSNCELEKISDFYFEQLYRKFYSSRYIGIKSPEIKRIVLELKYAENKLLNEEPLHHHYLMQYNKLKCLNTEMQERIRLITFDLENQKKYLDIMKRRDESVKINKFYYYEYEILPSWYKRFGHLLKVIMGRRSFRSLFDNNVKKYKD